MVKLCLFVCVWELMYIMYFLVNFLVVSDYAQFLTLYRPILLHKHILLVWQTNRIYIDYVMCNLLTGNG